MSNYFNHAYIRLDYSMFFYTFALDLPLTVILRHTKTPGTRYRAFPGANIRTCITSIDN